MQIACVIVDMEAFFYSVVHNLYVQYIQLFEQLSELLSNKDMGDITLLLLFS